jgi:thiol-disulfide isomerase/thioredoxin
MSARWRSPEVRPVLRAGALPAWGGWWRSLCGGLAALGLSLAAQAEGIPAAFKAMVLQPTSLPLRHEFDLTAPLLRAKKEGKRLYLYLGAHDCPYCRRYEAFLEKNAAELLPHFAPYLVVDLRSALMVQAKSLHFRIADHSWAYADFQREIGDERARQLVYPSVWLLDAQARPLMQMPGGAGTFETVPEQIEVLNLVN